MTSVVSDGYQEWKQAVRRGRRLPAGFWRFWGSCCSHSWPLLSQCTLLQAFSFSYRKMRRWGLQISSIREEGSRLSIPVNCALDYWLFGDAYILSSPPSFLLSNISRNGCWVIEQLRNAKFQLGIRFLHLLGQHSSFGHSNFQHVTSLQIQDFHLILWLFAFIYTLLFGNISIDHSKCHLISSAVILLLFP